MSQQDLTWEHAHMNLKEIETEILHLSKDERAELAQKILISLDSPSVNETADDWLLEAKRRAKELDEGTVQPIPAEEVRRKAQALLSGFCPIFP